ncbi:hypothetical protein DL96DRAFT_1701994 [Flagelloscypha sp. PMI_526]|nr:hypothetical protein DL96DRAFT_1701994 [Flagelloscypha sp. PMI_526]
MASTLISNSATSNMSSIDTLLFALLLWKPTSTPPSTDPTDEPGHVLLPGDPNLLATHHGIQITAGNNLRDHISESQQDMGMEDDPKLVDQEVQVHVEIIKRVLDNPGQGLTFPDNLTEIKILAPCHTMTYKNGGWVEDPRGSHMSLGLYPGYNNYTTHLYCSPKNAEGADSETRARLLDIAKK